MSTASNTCDQSPRRWCHLTASKIVVLSLIVYVGAYGLARSQGVIVHDEHGFYRDASGMRQMFAPSDPDSVFHTLCWFVFLPCHRIEREIRSGH